MQGGPHAVFGTTSAATTRAARLHEVFDNLIS